MCYDKGTYQCLLLYSIHQDGKFEKDKGYVYDIWHIFWEFEFWSMFYFSYCSNIPNATSY